MFNKTSFASYGASRFSGVIGEAWKLVVLSLDLRTDSPLEAELIALTASHLAILVHKRAKHLEGIDTENSRRWRGELENFVQVTLWPQLVESQAIGSHGMDDVTKMVDAIVAAEQRKAATASAQLPNTSRFDTSWVT